MKLNVLQQIIKYIYYNNKTSHNCHQMIYQIQRDTQTEQSKVV